MSQGGVEVHTAAMQVRSEHFLELTQTSIAHVSI